MDGSGIKRRLKFITYNVHSGIGRDGRRDVDRIRKILQDERADVAALQEIEQASEADQAQELAESVSATASFCATRPAGNGLFGLAVITALPVLHCEKYDLSY